MTRFSLALRFAAVLAMAPALSQAAQPGVAGLCGECRMEKFATCGGFLEGSTVDASGGLWVVDLLGGNIISVTDAGQCVVRGKTGGQPNGAKFHPDGRLLITDKAKGVVAFDTKTGAITVVADTYKTERLRGTNDLAIDSKGGFYFTEPYGSSALEPNGRVFYMPPGPKAQPVLVAGGLGYPNGVAIQPGEEGIVVGEFALKRIMSIPSATSTNAFDTPLVWARTEGGTGPDGMMFDAAGRLIVANFRGGELLVFAPDSHPLGVIKLPEGAGPMVTNVAIRAGWLYLTEASKGEIWRVKVDPSASRK